MLKSIKTHAIYVNSNRKSASPHVYALADFAYEALKSNSYKSQCCVIRYYSVNKNNYSYSINWFYKKVENQVLEKQNQQSYLLSI